MKIAHSSSSSSSSYQSFFFYYILPLRGAKEQKKKIKIPQASSTVFILVHHQLRSYSQILIHVQKVKDYHVFFLLQTAISSHFKTLLIWQVVEKKMAGHISKVDRTFRACAHRKSFDFFPPCVVGFVYEKMATTSTLLHMEPFPPPPPPPPPPPLSPPTMTNG